MEVAAMNNEILIRTAARWKIPRELAVTVLARDLCCIYCNRDFDLAGPRASVPSWEHIVNDVSLVNAANIALCCCGCNASKGRKALIHWLDSKYCKERGITGTSISHIAAAALGAGENDGYEQAKSGNWDLLLRKWSEVPLFAVRCSRYQKPSSGWSFLHQAAYFGNEAACRELIRLGSSVSKKAIDRKTAADVAREKGYLELAALLQRATQEDQSLWSPPIDPNLLPSSSLWNEANERRAQNKILVSYAGGVVKIPEGAKYFVDSFGLVLVGWHGTYDPPCGMDGESML